ncbi:MAG: GMC family oxidoreductase N-terminal domain-containing protein, partial [Acidobacteria bacterium]|nr:GMC family oxidoreductase N-terminal domain-containing protein [Acidobacteriota bacterium]
MSTSRRRFLRDSLMLAGATALLPRTTTADDAFDYVVIGAGSSGCVVVNRLTANPQVRVLLLEAGGPDNHPLVPVIGQWTSLIGTDLDWKYTTEPEPGLGGRSVPWPRGKTYGGSSVISAAAYARGHQLDFDGWAREAGADWSYQSVLPYFRMSEDNTRGPSPYHGVGGPMAVADTTDPHAGHLAFLEAARELGFAADPQWDFNGATQENGAGFYQKNLKNGRRDSAASGFLTPILGRPNLVVRPFSQVKRLLFTGTRVTGVEYVRGRATPGVTAVVERVRVEREVIVSAGAIDTPKILMLSGIGPADHLRSHGIPLILDLPGVGANLHDHPRIGFRWAGQTTLPGSSVSAGLLTHSVRGVNPGAPDLQFYVGRGLSAPDTAIALSVTVSRPHSRGSITLRSADLSAAPVIRAGYFTDARDMDAAVEGVRLARAIAHCRAYDRLRGAAADPLDTETTPEQIRAFIRRVAATIYHPGGTCRMGRRADAVVDPQLRVRGIDGLRVADASIMPTVVNAQTHAACVMIGERAAQ